AAADLLARARVALAATALDCAARAAAEGARHRRRAASLVVARGAAAAARGGTAGAPRAGRAPRARAREPRPEGHLLDHLHALRRPAGDTAGRGGAEHPPNDGRAAAGGRGRG